MSGGIVGAVQRRFGPRPASLLLSTPVVLVIASLDAFLAGAKATARAFADDFSLLRARRKELRRTPPPVVAEEGER